MPKKCAASRASAPAGSAAKDSFLGVRRLGALAVLIAGVGAAFVATVALASSPVLNDSTRTETLWRGFLGPDALFVRATWIPAIRSNRCVAFMGGSSVDSDEVHPKYLDYRIEDARGGVRLRDLVSGPDFGVCVDGLWAKSDAWESGLLLTVSATG